MKKITNQLLLFILMLGSILNLTPLVSAETKSPSAIQFVDQVVLSNNNGPISSLSKIIYLILFLSLLSTIYLTVHYFLTFGLDLIKIL